MTAVPPAVPLAGSVADERLYWTNALELVADTLRDCTLEKFKEKREKLQASIRYAAHVWREHGRLHETANAD